MNGGGGGGGGGETPFTFDVEQILLAGYTGRDRAKVRDHIQELETIGIAPPWSQFWKSRA